ncbi:uncharacterized protein TNCV_5058531 [Trichonephila clavipes]|nr:uncharacterized protein TNCV_5058531 [Trichonephila clavipes]
MTRLPFGCKTSPFMLSATIKKHIRKFREDKPKSAEMLDTSHYVDDLYFGAKDIYEAYELSRDAVMILKKAGMNLRKLNTNCEKLRSMWIQQRLVRKDSGSNGQLKVLGLNWKTVKDELSLDGCSKQWKQFVCNCVVEIQEKYDPKSWNHCSGRENPADIVSRDASMEHLLQNKLWCLRLDWMCSEQGLYNHYSTKNIPTDIVEGEKTKTVVFSAITDCNCIGYLLPKYSSFQKLHRVVACCLRYVENLRSLSFMQTKFLYAAELNQAHTILIMHIQR